MPRSMPQHFATTYFCILFTGFLAGFSGCQCCGRTERYMDRVDRVADHEGWLEWAYCPSLDLTRIGRRDWCCNPVNNWLCPCRCNQCPPVACPTYVHLGYGWENRAMKKAKPVKAMPDDAEVPEGNTLPEPAFPPTSPDQNSDPPVQAPAPQQVQLAPAPVPYYQSEPEAALTPVIRLVTEETIPAPATIAPGPETSVSKGISNSAKAKRVESYVTPISGTK